jgi:hypothetical protein
MMIVVKCIISLFAIAMMMSRPPAVHADEGGLRSEERALDLAELVQKLDLGQQSSASVVERSSSTKAAATCKDYTSIFDPKYRECTAKSNTGDTVVARRSLGFNPNDLCVHARGVPCRGSYLCPKGSTAAFALDCRNVYKPGTKCAASDCSGKCISYPATSKQLTFSYNNNKCGKMGWHCVGIPDYPSLASCDWDSYLPNGKVVRVGTNEPSASIGQPDSLGYYGECFPTVNGKPCKSCTIGCTLPGGNYAQFDCTNLFSSYANPKCPA